MHRLTLAIVAALTLVAVPAADRAPGPEVENAAAFARLYGVVRYFYPSDAAAALDWNRLAIHGVMQARRATDSRQLEAVLQQLFSPLGPGIAIAGRLPPALPEGAPDNGLVAWRYLGAGMEAAGAQGPYRRVRTNRHVVAAGTIDGFVSLMQTVPADALRGRQIRLSGQVRAATRDATGAAALWLRVDRPNQAVGFFDNMGNRPIRSAAWAEYAIEGTVADDATSIALGAMASGAVSADFDAISLAVHESNGTWTPVPLADAGFEAAASASGGWNRVGSSTTAQVTRGDDQPPQGRQYLRLAGATGSAAAAALFESAAPRLGGHVDIELGAGLVARVPLALPEEEATGGSTDRARLEALRAALAGLPEPGDTPDVDVRLADVVVAWNVFRHFYPYGPESGVNWDARLRPQLARAYDAGSRTAHRDALRRLVADARDGHGSVTDTRAGGARGALPVRFTVIGSDLVIAASSVPSEAPVGAVVTTIDGVGTAALVAGQMELASGTTQWKQARALTELTVCVPGETTTLALDSGTGPRPARLLCEAKPSPAEKRPEAVTELAKGVWYVDATRALLPQVKSALPQLALATGVIVDVRGYPNDSGIEILRHLVEGPEQDRWMHIARITGPFAQVEGWDSFGWNLTPASPRFGGKVVFLTDGRAISYAESVMGYVSDRKLGTIVGGTTAGTNGNVAMFAVPSGFAVTFTGMRVTRHDGRTPFHLVGVAPDVAAAATVAGLRAGRDEVLERALVVIQDR